MGRSPPPAGKNHAPHVRYFPVETDISGQEKEPGMDVFMADKKFPLPLRNTIKMEHNWFLCGIVVRNF
jgi:hypothetical protein